MGIRNAADHLFVFGTVFIDYQLDVFVGYTLIFLGCTSYQDHNIVDANHHLSTAMLNA